MEKEKGGFNRRSKNILNKSPELISLTSGVHNQGGRMFIKHSSAKISYPVQGIVRRILAHSDKVMLTEHTLEKGAVLPEHDHPHDQLVYLLSGEISIWIGEQEIKMLPGDSVAIKGGEKHKAAALKPSIALDIFAPPRSDYL
jgi:quercetin dioxygenase-like cupin family protein